MAIQVCTKITSKLNFLYRKRRFLWKFLRRFLCNSLIPPYFDYAFAAWYPNLNQKYRNKLHISQNKCIRFCLQLDNRGHIRHCTKNEKILNGKLHFFVEWELNILIRQTGSQQTKDPQQCLSTSVFKLFSQMCLR